VDFGATELVLSGAAGFLTPNYFALSSYTLLSKPSLTQIDE